MTETTLKKYQLVIDEWFVNGFNGRKAYRKYYPKASDETADVEFNRILSIPKVAEYKKEKEEEAQKTLRTSHKTMLEELENWAYSDITQTILLPPEEVKELPEEVRRLITKYETVTKRYQVGGEPVTETSVKLSFVSKEEAMRMIHKHTGFYEKHNSQQVNKVIVTLPDNGRNQKN